jgi:hypothetical protein
MEDVLTVVSKIPGVVKLVKSEPIAEPEDYIFEIPDFWVLCLFVVALGMLLFFCGTRVFRSVFP